MTTKENPQQQSSQRGGAGNFAQDPKRASEVGQKGGQHSGAQHSGGNFAEDRERASEAGRKGGQHGKGGR